MEQFKFRKQMIDNKIDTTLLLHMLYNLRLLNLKAVNSYVVQFETVQF